jgi:hypothetical protein
MAAKSVPPCDEKIAQAKLLYDSGVTPIGEILELLNMSVGQFRRFREIITQAISRRTFFLTA